MKLPAAADRPFVEGELKLEGVGSPRSPFSLAPYSARDASGRRFLLHLPSWGIAHHLPDPEWERISQRARRFGRAVVATFVLWGAAAVLVAWDGHSRDRDLYRGALGWLSLATVGLLLAEAWLHWRALRRLPRLTLSAPQRLRLIGQGLAGGPDMGSGPARLRAGQTVFSQAGRRRGR